MVRACGARRRQGANTRRANTKTTDAKKTRPRNKTQGVLSSMSRNRPVSECTTPTECATVQWHRSHGDEVDEERIQWERRALTLAADRCDVGLPWIWCGRRSRGKSATHKLSTDSSRNFHITRSIV
jgi:hypothetical protein